LRQWRRASAVISLLQLVLMLAVFALVLWFATAKVWVYVLAALILLLELTDWVIARRALKDAPSDYCAEAYRSRPLSAADRRLVTFNLVSLVGIGCLLLLSFPMATFRHHKAAGALMLAIAAAPGAIAMWRVRVHNSWRAVGRIPSPSS
jgi:hypothetical protein